MTGVPTPAHRRQALRGHRNDALGRSPFRPVVPSVAAALVYAMATLAWVVAGDRLPGGRWLAVHLSSPSGS